jgi:ElaB/YqjD/DUF883 family membrane-anchored ribosome-binding protein
MNSSSTVGTAPKSNGPAEEFADRVLEHKRAGVPGLHDQAVGNAPSAFGQAKDAVVCGASETSGDAVEGAATTDFDALREDLAKLTQTIGQLVQNQAASTRAQVMDVVGAAGDNISDTASVVQDTLTTIEAGVEAQIRKNPWSAVAVALGLGLLVGKLS